MPRGASRLTLVGARVRRLPYALRAGLLITLLLFVVWNARTLMRFAQQQQQQIQHRGLLEHDKQPWERDKAGAARERAPEDVAAVEKRAFNEPLGHSKSAITKLAVIVPVRLGQLPVAIADALQDLEVSDGVPHEIVFVVQPSTTPFEKLLGMRKAVKALSAARMEEYKRPAPDGSHGEGAEPMSATPDPQALWHFRNQRRKPGDHSPVNYVENTDAANAELLADGRSSSSSGGLMPDVASFSELANFGALMASKSDASHLLFLSEFFVPVRGSGFVRKMASLLHGALRAGVVGCQLIRPAAVAADATSGAVAVGGDGVVIEHGVEVAFGRDAGAQALFMAKRLNGHSVRDARAGRAEEAIAVSHHCMMLRREDFANVFRNFSGSTHNSMQDVLTGVKKRSIHRALDRLRMAILGLESAMSSVSIMEIQQYKSPLRALVRKAYAVVVEATGVWETASKFKWVDPAKPRLAEAVVGEAERFRQQAEHLNIQQRLEAYMHLVESSLAFVRQIATHSADVSSEDETGWDLGLRAAEKNVKVYTSTARAELNDGLLEPLLRDYRREHPQFELMPPSILVTGEFRQRWGEQLRLSHRSRSAQPTAPIKVVWDAFCCNCCGFTNEIVHLTLPLQSLHAVNIIPELSCFCSGFPDAVMDSLRRMHLTKRQFLLDQAADDEVVVWVSHTDPTGYANKVFETRRPDYIVGRSMYEFSRIDLNWVIDANRNADEVWVPAEWVKRVFVSSGVDESKVVIVPEAVDTHFFDPNAQRKIELPPVKQKWKFWCNRETPRRNTRTTAGSSSSSGGGGKSAMPQVPEAALLVGDLDSELDGHAKASDGAGGGVGDSPYTFFSNFKWEDRKGWDILLRAYMEAFTPDDHVSLYILTHIWFPGDPDTYGDKHNVTFLQEAILDVAQTWGVESLDELPHFCLILADLSEVEVAQLYNSIDAFVLPTRGEGWGLPAIQAMAMAKPTISTNWGGQMEFLRPECSFPIPLDGVEEIPKDSVYRWRFGKKWALPSREATVELMQLVFHKRKEAAVVGLNARRFIHEHFSEEAVARQIDKRLLHIRDVVLARRRSFPK